MIVRRTRGEKIKIIHETSGDVFKITLQHIFKCSSIEVDFDYDSEQYCVGNSTSFVQNLFLLNRTSEVDIFHKSGDKMMVQVCDISYKDANIRLVDKNRYFRFEWSKRILSTQS
jgi:hypothetical protein